MTFKKGRKNISVVKEEDQLHLSLIPEEIKGIKNQAEEAQDLDQDLNQDQGQEKSEKKNKNLQNLSNQNYIDNTILKNLAE